MNTVGFPISHKENEKRRALLPTEVVNISVPGELFFEKGYGQILGYSDDDYMAVGANVVSREQVLQQSIICDPKVGDADYLEQLSGQTVFGWIHAVQNRSITDKLLNNKLTGYAWEDMFEGGRHVFWRNNELAGESAVIHAIQSYGRLPYETKTAVIGRGNTARGAIKILNMLGAEVMQYERKTEALLREEIGKYDIVVNCVLWDTTRKDHIITREDLKRMKPGAMIIDVSCDRNGGIETCVPTTFENPTYTIDGIMHYCVDHTPSLFYKTFSHNNSIVIYPYIEQLITNQPGKVLENALIIKEGKILDKRIIDFQKRQNSSGFVFPLVFR